jgi:hypothetical protein
MVIPAISNVNQISRSKTAASVSSLELLFAAAYLSESGVLTESDKDPAKTVMKMISVKTSGQDVISPAVSAGNSHISAAQARTKNATKIPIYVSPFLFWGMCSEKSAVKIVVAVSAKSKYTSAIFFTSFLNH